MYVCIVLTSSSPFVVIVAVTVTLELPGSGNVHDAGGGLS